MCPNSYLCRLLSLSYAPKRRLPPLTYLLLHASLLSPLQGHGGRGFPKKERGKADTKDHTHTAARRASSLHAFARQASGLQQAVYEAGNSTVVLAEAVTPE